ncbi:Jacalin-like lectin domain-containing protein [Xylaria longipes]|nr:Jacalin-like lectin domain-containing protein [Xylaria longipes]RYC65038.1 hypothetical protein CHU98_g1147 [Xylaria longipes]
MAELLKDRDIGKTVGIAQLYTNQTQGGSSGDGFKLNNEKKAVKTITVWINKGPVDYLDRDLVRAIEVVWTDGKTRSQGNKSGDSSSFTFDDDEKVTKLSLWAGGRVDKLSLTTNRTTWVNGGTGGTEHAQKLGNGILLGFSGSSDKNGLVSLGAIFKEDSD